LIKIFQDIKDILVGAASELIKIFQDIKDILVGAASELIKISKIFQDIKDMDNNLVGAVRIKIRVDIARYGPQY